MQIYLTTAGSSMLLVGVILIYKRMRFVAQSAVAIGNLVSYYASSSADHHGSRTHFFPIIRFWAQDGKKYELTSAAGYSSKKYPEGHEFRVRYSTGNPSKAFVDNFLNLWTGPLALTAMGIIVLSIAMSR